MAKLTLKRAKELSVKKWQYITDNNGSDSGVTTKIRSLKNCSGNCGMCEYQRQQNDGDCNCNECLYNDICGKPFSDWTCHQTTYYAKKVLEAIIETNEKKIL